MEFTTTERWEEARGRIEPYIHAVFWQDLGIDDARKYTDWILDKFVRPEFCAILTDRWSIWKTDADKNRIIIQAGLRYSEARKQLSGYSLEDGDTEYWLEPDDHP